MKKILFLAAILIAISSCYTNKKIDNLTFASTDFSEEIKQHREDYKSEFVQDQRAPLKKNDLKYLRFFDPDERYVCDCTFTETPESKPFEMATYSGETRAYKKFGEAVCSINKSKAIVNIYRNLTLLNVPGYKDYLFIPFKDHTNAESTYGGGRYIDIVTGDIKNGRVTLDFNKCYNPWCAYSDGYSCPIPPVENHFDFEILAGEKMWTGKKKH